jgi:urease accessory protein
VSADLALVELSPRAPAAGTARLRFSRNGAQTILERSFATSPVKLFTTRGAGGACWVYSATLGGGLVGGDAIRMSIEVETGARALLATQASTKVYRSLRPASQHLAASLGDGTLLAVVPDPIVCFAGAHFSQEQRYDLNASASLVLVDWMTSGRHAVGERWAFHHYANRIDIRRAGRRILYESVLLSRTDGSVAERLDRFDVCLTAIVTGPLVSNAAAGLIQQTAGLPVEKRSNLIVAAWPLADGGTLLRMFGVSVEQIGAALRERSGFLCHLLGDDPWKRKW